MHDLVRIRARVINRPLLVLPHVAETICSVLAERIGVEPMVALPDTRERKPNANRFFGDAVMSNRGDVVYTRIGDTGVVTVEGELVNRGAWIGTDSGLTSYEGIETQLIAAASDPKVSRILLDIDSPGGEAVGAMELASMVRKINREKPVYALANGMAASAAYAMASGSTRLYTTPSGITGSIGVVLLHLDHSAQLEKRGIKPTLIFAGAHKVDGHPFGPLPDSVAEDLKAEVNGFYQQFIETVSAGRSTLTEQAIRATEARTYTGKDAVKANIADAVATFDEVLTEIKRAPGRSTQVAKGVTMSDTQSAPAANNAGIPKSEHDAAVVAAGKAAQARIAAIIECDEAKGRTAMAKHIAFNTDMSVDAAKAMLAVAPSEAAKPAVPSLDERMAGRQSLGPDANAQPQRKKVEVPKASDLYAARSAERAKRTPKPLH